MSIPLEIAVFDALVPALAVAFLAAIFVMFVLDRVFVRRDVYSHVWYPALFRLAVFCILFSAFGLVIY
ncbi:MAG: DUF1656 domain-containing protein [Methylobacillus sp.]|jgi:putative flippase GtrA|nr:DUF1656 domain-containing protein [Methylobacillus sp.]